MIGKLPGHDKIETISHYAHPALASMHETAARVADSIEANILDRPRPCAIEAA